MSTVSPATNDQDETESHEGWNAFRVWSERVRQPCGPLANAPAHGWDPYFVWLSRVRKPDQ